MKIALCQPRVYPCDWDQNVRQLIDFARKASTEKCDLLIAPAEALFGGENSDKNIPRPVIFKILRELASQIKDCPLLCAYPDGGYQFVLLANGMAIHVAEEVIIQNRHFILKDKALEKLVNGNLPIFRINAVSTPWHIGKNPFFENTLMVEAKSKKAWILSCSIAGGYGNLVYDGTSLIINPRGEIIRQGEGFKPDIIFFDTEREENSQNPIHYSQAILWNGLVTGTRDFVLDAGAKSVVIGLSGGMDSAIVTCIACDALGKENVTGILMPSKYSSKSSITDAMQLAENLGIRTFSIPIEPAKAAFTQSLLESGFSIPPFSLTDENLQPRIRGTLLMAISNLTGALVLNTGNKSEALMGYCTLHGDTVGALAVIGDLYKSQIYELAHWLNLSRGEIIPENILRKPPSAELRPDQKDEDTLPVYEELDKCLAWLLEESSEDMSDYPRLEEIKKRMEANSFKRSLLPPALLVGASQKSRG